MPQPKPFNPFYFLLALVGVTFCVSASAFGLMTLRQSRAPQTVLLEDAQNPVHPLMKLMDQHGMKILMGELGLLAVFTFGAIATDQMWSNKLALAEAREKSVQDFPPPHLAPDADKEPMPHES